MNINAMTNNTLVSQSSIGTERFIVTTLATTVCVFGVPANLMVIFLVWRYPQLRQNCKYLQAALAAGDVVLCSGSILNYIGSMVLAYAIPRMVRWQCLLISSPNAAGIMYSSLLTVCIALDRCYGIIFPIRYWKMDKASICGVSVGITLIITLACIAATFCDVILYDYPIGCFGASSRSARLNALINYFVTVSGGIVFVISPATLTIMWVKIIKLSKGMPNNGQNRPFEQQILATTSISCVIAAGLILYVIPNTAILILVAQNINVYNARAYVGLTSAIHSSINCLLYIWKEPKMRSKLKDIFSTGSNGVQIAPAEAVAQASDKRS